MNSVQSFGIAFLVILLICYLFFTFNPDFLFFGKYTKDSDTGCVKASGCMTVSLILAVSLPILFVMVRAGFRAMSNDNKTQTQ